MPTHGFWNFFAGIGGWGQAISTLFPVGVPIFSVELDPTVATALSTTTKRSLFDIDEFLEDPWCENAVIVADVFDPRWWITTLVNPFTGLGWSTPCQPWSQAGKLQGLHHPVGRLLIHSIGILSLFGIPQGAMENVPGLVEHPHWKQIRHILDRMPTPCKVVKSDLAKLGYMSRLRCFLLFGIGNVDERFKDFHLRFSKAGDWVRPHICDRLALDQTQVPAEARKLLSKRILLPDPLKLEALMSGFQDGNNILKLRILTGATFPTLVASYRKQTRLSPAHLARKGILTWLIEELHSPGGVRFLDIFEGSLPNCACHLTLTRQWPASETPSLPLRHCSHVRPSLI